MAAKANENKAEAVEAKAVTPKVVAPKKVKVKSKISGNKFIGGTWYSLEKDKEIEVTQDAKRVLLEANAIYI